MLPDIKVNTDIWTGLWAMEKRALQAFMFGPKAAKAAKATTQPPVQQYTVSGTTAIIPLVGCIGKYPSAPDDNDGECVSTLQIQNQINAALTDDTIEQIVLFIDSPGGTIAGTSDLADYIASARQLKPIIAYVSDHCCSAAYWIAANCTHIVANEGAFVGSIGVYCVLTDASKAAEDAGLHFTLVAAGDYKGLEEAGIPIGDKAISETQRVVNAAYELFIKSVSAGRNLEINAVRELADGRVHIASNALTLNLIDGIGTLDSALSLEGMTMTENKIAKAVQSVAAPLVAAATTDQPAASPDNDVLKQLLTLVQSLVAKVDELTPDEEDEPDTDGSPSEADDDSAGVDAKVATAVAADRDRLKAISEACNGRADFAITQFIAGKSPTEAKAALADVLVGENATLRKQAKAGDGMEPLALGSAVAVDNSDPEQIWATNAGDVQKKYSGKKDYFLAAHKHKLSKARRAANGEK